MDSLSRALLTVGGGVTAPTYVDDVFATYLYTGTGATQTITNDIDLAGKGGMVWVKSRSNVLNNLIGGPDLGTGKTLIANSSLAALSNAQYWPAFNSNGFGIGTDATWSTAGATFVSWTFRKAPKFFDVVTYTGDGSGSRNLSHSLGKKPGLILTKSTSGTGDWFCWARSSDTQVTVSQSAATAFGVNQIRAGFTTSIPMFVNAATNTSFNCVDVTVAGDPNACNVNGVNYVAYLFAHDTAADGLIQCGSFTTDSSGNASVTSLGWEPQFLMVKASSTTGDWIMLDSMRGWNMTTADARMLANSAAIESTATDYGNPTATGFDFKGGGFGGSATYIYMAIRRPNKPPTTGTSVFSSVANSNAIDGSNPVALTPAASDLWLSSGLSSAAPYWQPRLTGWKFMRSSVTSAEDASYTWNQTTQNNLLTTTTWYPAGEPQVNYFFKRAPGFFDVVCYTGTGAALTVNHNLGVAPELVITKFRSTTGAWTVTTTAVANLFGGQLSSSAALSAFQFVGNMTSTSFTAGYANIGFTSTSGVNYVAYLFASLPGISKVGTYTGNGSSLTINCGFTTGARFIMIKAFNVGDWYVWDTARGIVAGNDPHLSMNNTAAQVTTNDSIDPDNTGFIVNQDAATNINVTSATYLYLAIA
jgi:hypothetical protein